MKNKKINKALLAEELKRFKSLTDYDFYVDKNNISENFPFPIVSDNEEKEDDNLILGSLTNEAEGDDVENTDELVGDITADIETNQDAPIEEPATDVPAETPPVDNLETPETPMEEPAMDAPAGDEIELDVTELVKGSEAAKESADAANSKIEQLMDMVNKLENQLTTMSTISSKIDALEKEIEVRNPTPKEKLEMRSLDSYPYNIKLTDFWAEKGDRYETGAEEEKPKEYILKQSDIDNDYIESDIEDSFNADDYEKKNNF
jgi:hypothetical protein